MKTAAKAILVNEIFADVSVPSATIISTFAIELQ